MAPHHDLPGTLTAAALEMDAARTTAHTLQTMVTVAQRSLDDIDEVGVTLAHRNGRLVTDASTGPLVVELDELQYAFDEGPCLSALREEADLMVVEDLSHETRWPRFVSAAADRGVTAQLGARLFVDDHTVGVLNLYSTSSPTLSAETRHLAEMFATHAALAYGHARTLGDLQVAIAHRELVGKAIGIVMERYALGAERAFDYLVQVSSTSETPVRDLAQEIVRQAEGRSGTGPA
jgi:GAF domain-containing protein